MRSIASSDRVDTCTCAVAGRTPRSSRSARCCHGSATHCCTRLSATSPPAVTAKISFGKDLSDLPYHADWTAIYVKPIRASPASPSYCEKKAKQEREGKVIEPLPVRTPPTNMGNVYEQ